MLNDYYCVVLFCQAGGFILFFEGVYLPLFIRLCPFVLMTKSRIYKHNQLFIFELLWLAFFSRKCSTCMNYSFLPGSYPLHWCPATLLFSLLSSIYMQVPTCIPILMHMNWQLNGILVSPLLFCLVYFYHCSLNILLTFLIICVFCTFLYLYLLMVLCLPFTFLPWLINLCVSWWLCTTL